jgi:hypothetical protein
MRVSQILPSLLTWNLNPSYPSLLLSFSFHNSHPDGVKFHLINHILFYNLISEMTSHHFCCVLFIRSKLLSLI